MTISFPNIPANIRVPFFYAEVDNSQASYFAEQQRALLIGQMLPTGTAEPNVPVLLASGSQEIPLFGAGSHLARMAQIYRQNDSFGEVWCLPMPADEAAEAAEGTITITGAPTSGGTIYLYIAGQLVKVKAVTTDTPTTLATALKNAINALPSLPVSAASALGVVTLTAIQEGLAGNDVDIRMNVRGEVGGERTPDGINLAIVAMAGGTGAPDVATALAGLGDEEFDFVACPYTDGVTLDALRDEWNDQTGRWAWSRQIYGHVFSAKRGTVGDLQTFGATRNDPHVTVIGYKDSPTPPWEWVGAWVGQAAKSLKNDPARPLQTLALVGVVAPVIASRFTMTERQTLLFSGVATWYANKDGAVRIERSITTYQRNAWDQADPSYLDIQTLFTLVYVLRFMRQAVTQKFGRHMLADDGTNFGVGKAIVTPSAVRGELIAQYSFLMSQGLVENIEAFKANLIVERNAGDPNRLDVLYTPDLVNQLRIFAVLAQFRLQYPVAA